MKKIIISLFLLLTVNISFALTSTPEIDKKYSAYNCGLTKDQNLTVDRASKDICYSDISLKMFADIFPELIEKSMVLKGTEFKQYQKDIKAYNKNQTNASNSARTLTAQFFFNVFIHYLFIIVSATIVVLTLKNFGDIRYREYSFIREVGFKMLGLLLIIPTSVGPIGVYIAGEMYFWSKMENNKLMRNVIADQLENQYTIKEINNKEEIVNFAYETAVKPVNTMLYARTALSQTGKFFNQFIEEGSNSSELTSNLNNDITMKSDSILFNRTRLGMNYYDAGSITLLPTSVLFNPFLRQYITDNKDGLIEAVKNTEKHILDNNDKEIITISDINDIYNVLNISYNNAYKAIIKDIWENDIHELHQKTLEKQCFNSGLGTYSKSYVKKLNGNLPSNEDEGLSFCVEKINGEYVALGAEAKIDDITGSSKSSADINKENTEYVIKRKREIVMDKIIPLQVAYLKAFNSISNSTAENKMIKDFAANPILYAPMADISIKKFSYNKKHSIKMLLENGLTSSNNNANSNMILESAKMSEINYTVISDNLADLKLSSAVLDINAENINIKTLGINVKEKTLEQHIDENDTNALTKKIYGSFLQPLKQFKIDAGMTAECQASIECVSSKQDNYIGSLAGFGQNLKDTSYIIITSVIGAVAVKQTAGMMKGKNADKKSKAGSITETKKKSKIFSALKFIAGFAYYTSVIAAVMAVPIYFVGMFLANILPFMISIPFFIMTVSYELMMIAILTIGLNLFILFRLFNVNDDNNARDIFYKLIVFPLVVLFVPTIVYTLSVIYKAIIFWLFYIFIIVLILPTASNGILEFFVAMLMMVYIIIFIITASLMIAINVVNIIYEMTGFDKIFTLNITQYAEEVNNLFLKVVPFSHTISNLIFSKGILSNRKKR